VISYVIMDDETVLQQKWEERARRYQDDPRGVLFRGLPGAANEAIHNWHEAVVRFHFAPLLPKNARILDIGAGYGRLSALIRQERPQSQLVGVDFSKVYCRIYAEKKIAHSICADIRNLPFVQEIWDGILVVTTLMYIPQAQCHFTVKQIIACLKPGGVALFIDPGLEIIRVLRRLSPGLKQKTTGGHGFDRTAYMDLVKGDNCIILSKGSNTFFTAFLPLFFMIEKIPWLACKLGRLTGWMDHRIRLFTRFSLHRWVLIRRV